MARTRVRGRLTSLPNRVLGRAGLRLVRTSAELPTRVRPAVGPAGAKTAATPLFVGATRFSVYDATSGAWKLTRSAADAESYRRRLYSPERMDPRCDIFVNLSVPILQRLAADHDYRHVVRYSGSMPQPYLDQLRAAAATHPVLLLLDADQSRSLADVVLDLARARGGSRTVVQFRLDDDDLLATTYLDQLSVFATVAEHRRAVSLASGFTAAYDGGRIGQPHEVRRVFGAQGLAYIGNYGAKLDAVRIGDVDGDHTKVHRLRPTIVHSGQPAFLQVRHTGQDMLADHDEAMARIEMQLAKLPVATDRAELLRLFPTLAGRLAAD